MKKFIVILLLLSQTALAKTLTLGSVSIEPSEEIKKYFPIAIYVANQLKAEGIDQGKILVARDIPEMASFV